MMSAMSQDAWADLADRFVDEASASVKGQVRTYVLHQHLRHHLPAPPAAILDVGRGAAHQSLPLARAGYQVTVLDSSPAMVRKAEQRLSSEPVEVRERVRLIHGDGEDASRATEGRPFAAVLCHGVLMCAPEPHAGQVAVRLPGLGLTSATHEEVTQIAAVEQRASRLFPYRRLSRVFHLIGRRRST